MENKVYKDICEEIYECTINSLKVVIIPKKGFLKKNASLVVNFGSKNLTFKDDTGKFKTYPEGIAHFLEHKVFESNIGNSFEIFSKLGASVNAFTNFDITNYYFNTIDNFEESLKELFKLVREPYFTNENVEKEKGIIEQEIKMYDDDPFSKLYYESLKGMYNSIPINKDIAGTVESIYKITPDILYENYNAFYTLENMTLIIVGDVVIQDIVDIVEELTKDSDKEITGEKFIYTEKEEIAKSKIELDLMLNLPKFTLSFKDVLPLEKDKLKQNVIMDFIKLKYFLPSSDIYEELYNEGLINESFEASYSLNSDYAFMMIFAESKDPKKAKNRILEYLSNEENKKVTKEEFDRIKKILIGSYFKSFDSIEGISYMFVINRYKGINFFDYYEEVKNLDIKEIEKSIDRIFNQDKSVFVHAK